MKKETIASLPVEPQRRVFVRSAYNYPKELVSELTGLSCPEESLAQQQFAEEVDINTLVRRFHLSGEFPTGVKAPTYGDFSEVYDFHTAANTIAEAKEAFEAMPAEVRFRFHNDPAEFVAFCSTEGNRPELERMGLVPPAPIATPVPAAPDLNSGSPGEGGTTPT